MFTCQNGEDGKLSNEALAGLIYRGYYTVERRNEFYVRVARTLLFLPREHKIHILELTCNLFLLCRHTDNGVSDHNRRFPTTCRRFPKIFQNCSEGDTNVPKHFRNFPKIAEDFRGTAEDVSIITQRI